MGRLNRQQDRDRRSRARAVATEVSSCKDEDTVGISSRSKSGGGRSSGSTVLTEESIWEVFNEYFRDISEKDVAYIDAICGGTLCKLDESGDVVNHLQSDAVNVRDILEALESGSELASGSGAGPAGDVDLAEIERLLRLIKPKNSQADSERGDDAVTAASSDVNTDPNVDRSDRILNIDSSSSIRSCGSSGISNGSKRVRTERGAIRSAVVTSDSALSDLSSPALESDTLRISYDSIPTLAKLSNRDAEPIVVHSTSNSTSHDVDDDKPEKYRVMDPSVWRNVLGSRCAASDSAYIDWFVAARRTNKTVRSRGRPSRNLVSLGPTANSITKRKWSGVCPPAPVAQQHPACWGPGTRVRVDKAIIHQPPMDGQARHRRDMTPMQAAINVFRFHPACVSTSKGVLISPPPPRAVRTPHPPYPQSETISPCTSSVVPTDSPTALVAVAKNGCLHPRLSSSTFASKKSAALSPGLRAPPGYGRDATDAESPLPTTTSLTQESGASSDASANRCTTSNICESIPGDPSEDVGSRKYHGPSTEVAKGLNKRSQGLVDIRHDIASLLNQVVHQNVQALQIVRRRAMHHLSAGEIRAWLADLQETVAIAESGVVAPSLKWRGVESAVNEATLHHLFLKYEMHKAEPVVAINQPSNSSIAVTDLVPRDAHSSTTSKDLFWPGALIEALLGMKRESNNPIKSELDKEWVLMKVIKVYRDGDENKFVKIRPLWGGSCDNIVVPIDEGVFRPPGTNIPLEVVRFSSEHYQVPL